MLERSGLLDYGPWETCNLCHMDSIATLRNSLHSLSQEFNTSLLFLHQHMQELDTGGIKHCQLMVMGGKKGYGPAFHKISHYCISQAHAVLGAGSSSDFVHDHQ